MSVMTVYHGGYRPVESPKINKGRFAKDFGEGFYCTTIKEQAERWARRNATPVVSRYEVRIAEGLDILDFKTMTDERDAEGNLLPDSERLTHVGKFVRSTSIDELPQLINILKGDMAFIGPRPLLVQYLPLYSEEQHRRHDVTPGMSGWAQVNGRNNISWTKKFELDVYYVDHISAAMDRKVFFTTIKKVLMRTDINTTTGQAATMDYFDGTN